MSNNWVLVADSSRARLFKRGNTWDDLELVQEDNYSRSRARGEHEADGDIREPDNNSTQQSGTQGSDIPNQDV